MNEIHKEIDNLSFLVKLVNGVENLQTSKVFIKHINYSKTDKTEKEHLETIRSKKRNFFRSLVKDFKIFLIKLKKNRIQFLQTTYELVSLIKNWFLKLSKNEKNDECCLLIDYRILNTSSFGEKILKIDKNGEIIILKSKKKYSSIENKLLKNTRNERGYNKNILYDQKKLLFFELFLRLKKDIISKKFKKLVYWGKIIIKGNFLQYPIYFFFNQEKWNNFRIFSIPIPCEVLKQIEKLCLRLLLNKGNNFSILEFIILKIACSQNFLLSYFMLYSCTKKYININYIPKISNFFGQNGFLSINKKKQFELEIYIKLNNSKVHLYWRDGLKKKFILTEHLSQIKEILTMNRI